MDLHLKPCPHCGSEAKLNIINDDPEAPNYKGNYIACDACGATTQLMFSCGEDCRPVLAELWNARYEGEGLRTAAADVISAFQELGKASHAAGLLMARSRCEAVMLKLSEALKA